MRKNSSRPPTADPDPQPIAGTVTAITPQARDPRRVSLFVDDQFVMGLDAEVAARLGVRPGMYVDQLLLEQARAEDEDARARADALAYLAARPRTRVEVQRRLHRRGYSAAAVDRTVDYLQQQGWLDDQEYARLYVRQQLEGRAPPGERRLAADLRRRGVAPEIVAAVLTAALGQVDAVEAAMDLVRRRLERTHFPDRDSAWRRLAGYLTRRGYDSETVSLALERVLAEANLPAARRRRTSGLRRGRGQPGAPHNGEEPIS